MYIYITAEKISPAIVTILRKKRFYEKQRTHQSKKHWYKIIAADFSVCSDCCAAFREFNIATNPAYGWQLMARSNGSECVVGSVNFSLYKAEIFQMQRAAPCCLWSLPMCPVKATAINTWHVAAIIYWLCIILSIVYCMYCLSSLLQPDIPWFIDPLGQNFPLELEQPSVSPKSPVTLETWEITHWRKHKCRSDVFFIPKTPKPSSHLLACCNRWTQRRGPRWDLISGGTFLTELWT